jgi:hypothetical protein
VLTKIDGGISRVFRMTLEPEYWKAVLGSVAKPTVPVIQFVPKERKPPTRTLRVDSAWKGVESIIGAIISQFHIGTSRCLEFGVEFGYSTVALSSFFDSVIGVDTFAGDQHTVNKEDIFGETLVRLSHFSNIQVVRSDFRDWIKRDDSSYDLIHVDIVHKYNETFACGLWSALHSQCVIFHDTESFPAVKRAVIEISRRTGKSFYNFSESNGLGILV